MYADPHIRQSWYSPPHLKVSLSVWRDEAHGRLRRDDEDSVDDDENSQHQDANNARSSRFSPSRPSSRGSSLTSGTSQVDRAPMTPQRDVPPTSNREEDEDEAFWKSLDEYAGDSSDAPPAPTTVANSSVEEDEFMWDVLDEVEVTSTINLAGSTSLPPPPTNSVEVSTTTNPDVADDWDDMYL